MQKRSLIFTKSNIKLLKLMTSKLCLMLVKTSNMPNAPTHCLLLVTGHFHGAPVRAESEEEGRIRTENDIKRLTVSGVKSASLPAQWDTLPKPCFWEGSGIRDRSLSPVTSYKTYLPLGGSGHSRGHVANHGVVHIRQRTRRTERKDIYISSYQA